MIPNINIGPPSVGAPNWPLKKSEVNEDRSDSFESTLGARMDKERPERPEIQSRTESKEPLKRGETTNLKTASTEKVSSRKEESRSEEGTGPSQLESKIGGRTKKASGEREKAIQKFMDSFESEFGIPPTRIVEAMAQLDPKQMLQAPEQTADAIIGQLDLGEEEVKPAKESYLNLVADLQQIDQKALQAQSPVIENPNLMNGPSSQNRSLQSKEKRMMINKSLDQMNQKFWMIDKSMNTQAGLQNPAVAPGQETMLQSNPWNANTLDMNSADSMMLNEETLNVPGQKSLNPQGPNSITPLPPEATASDAAFQQQLANLKSVKRKDQTEVEGEESSEGSKASYIGKAAVPLPEQQGAGAIRGATKVPAEDMMNPYANPQGNLNMKSGLSAKNSLAEKGFEVLKPGAEGAKKLDAMSGASTPHSMTPMKGELMAQSRGMEVTTAAASPMAVDAGNANQGLSEASIQSVMNQTKYLMKKGGGEAKVQLNPEGLGQLNMKVLVQDGKVSVQMAAESQETKKVLESSLPDLKSSLSSHKLNVEHIKVDVVNSANSSDQSQNLNQNQAQRDGTKLFWNQFQESFGSRSRQDGFFDMGNGKGYPQKKKDPLQPVAVESSSVKRSAQGEKKGKGLDLVA